MFNLLICSNVHSLLALIISHKCRFKTCTIFQFFLVGVVSFIMMVITHGLTYDQCWSLRYSVVSFCFQICYISGHLENVIEELWFLFFHGRACCWSLMLNAVISSSWCSSTSSRLKSLPTVKHLRISFDISDHSIFIFSLTGITFVMN